jgi:carbon-monoxide dehydrogenase large subunit
MTMSAAAAGSAEAPGIGKPVRRVEDERFIQGRGRYTDDIAAISGEAAHLFLLRSPHAAARIVSIDVAAAREAEGVLAVLTPAEMEVEGFARFPTRVKRQRADGSPALEPGYFPLARDAARHVGEGVVAIVAETLNQARDAAELVDIRYEPLDAVADTARAAEIDAPKVWAEFPDNICFEFRAGDAPQAEVLFAGAAHVVSERIVISRVGTNALEPRAALGEYDPRTGRYTLHAGLQSPHMIRGELATILGVVPGRIRVVAPDVGGAFGMKGSLHPELVLVLWAARLTGRPVRHTADRSESFMSDHQARDNVSDVSLALDERGRFLALRVETLANIGAYVASNGLHAPTNNVGGLAGVYTTQAFDVRVRGVFSNTVPTCPFRGAGRPEASFCIETIIDKAARKLALDRAEIRRRNLIPPAAMPYRTPLVFTYDSGEFEAVMDKCLKAADWKGFEKRRGEAKRRGMLRGIGIACVIEIAGGPPDRPFEEYAEIRFDPCGDMTIFAGSHSQGQGHETTYHQMAAELLGAASKEVRVVFGDTDAVAHGRGTFGSRTMMAFGAAFVRASERIVEKAKPLASHLLEAASEDLMFEHGRFVVTGTDRSISLRDVAIASFQLRVLPPGFETGLQASASVALDKSTFPNGCHICEVEIDPQTGHRDIVAYHVVDDVGTVVNPLLLKGQIHGGVAQGAGQILDEFIAFDADAQVLSGSFMDYGMPRAMDLPSIGVESHPVPTTTNPLGVKGAGEAGTVGALPAVMSAIRDALAPLGIEEFTMPATPLRLWRAIQDARIS